MQNIALRTYLTSFLLAIGGYVIILSASIYALDRSATSDWWRIPVALAPIVPLIFVMFAVVSYFGKIDELQRRIQVEALSFSAAGTALLTFSYGFLENVGFPHLSWFFVWPIIATLWMIGLAVASRRYH